MSKEDHLSLGKVAKRCNVSRTTVYRWIVNGHLKAYSLPSGHFRVTPDDILAGRHENAGQFGPFVGQRDLRERLGHG